MNRAIRLSSASYTVSSNVYEAELLIKLSFSGATHANLVRNCPNCSSNLAYSFYMNQSSNSIDDISSGLPRSGQAKSDPGTAMISFRGQVTQLAGIPGSIQISYQATPI